MPEPDPVAYTASPGRALPGAQGACSVLAGCLSQLTSRAPWTCGGGDGEASPQPAQKGSRASVALRGFAQAEGAAALRRGGGAEGGGGAGRSGPGARVLAACAWPPRVPCSPRCSLRALLPFDLWGGWRAGREGALVGAAVTRAPAAPSVRVAGKRCGQSS